jgi:hypothetical protein
MVWLISMSFNLDELSDLVNIFGNREIITYFRKDKTHDYQSTQSRQAVMILILSL